MPIIWTLFILHLKWGKNPYKKFVGFLVDLKTTKGHFEINWPLAALWMNNFLPLSLKGFLVLPKKISEPFWIWVKNHVDCALLRVCCKILWVLLALIHVSIHIACTSTHWLCTSIPQKGANNWKIDWFSALGCVCPFYGARFSCHT